jgi:putative CocE/NonD family hydrolase
MPIKADFPHAVRVIEHTWITLADGCRLAARIWLPHDAEAHPVPAILEYLPYRKNDGTAQRDAIRHPYFAGHGYASIRVDMRGSGDSDGILLDEYLPQEQDDALEVLAWIADQPWCSGSIGMIGISWGGFNGLQIAARRPPALKAVISLCSTDDRYADDVHYMGGCVLAADALPWAATMLALNAQPPDPKFVGERWRAAWLERLERTPPYIEAWLAHQRRDAFWKHGSVCENYADITCPVYAVGGWADGYSNAVPRLLAGLQCPRKGLIGPWAHSYPEVARPGPAIGFAQECLRWWDHWLKSRDTGIMDEPMLRVWMQESVAPHTFYAERAGRWVAEPAWPSPNLSTQRYDLGSGTLEACSTDERRKTKDEELDGPGPSSSVVRQTVGSAQTHGLHAGVWCPYGQPGDFPGDQRGEDGLALCFTSAPLDARMEILGFPELTLEIAADQPRALLAVRLCDVAPDGTSTLITRGLLNLTHRDSHEYPEPLNPGQRYQVRVRLNAIAHALPARHQWRVAIAPTYWPHAWPSPAPVTLSVFGGQLDLPVRPGRPEDAELPPFGPPEHAAPLPVEVLRAAVRERHICHTTSSGVSELVDRQDGGAFRIIGDGLENDDTHTEVFTIREGDPLSATIRCEWTIAIGRGKWRTRIAASSTLSAEAEAFLATNTLDAYENDTRIFAKTWSCTIPRELV